MRLLRFWQQSQNADKICLWDGQMYRNENDTSAHFVLVLMGKRLYL